jgi:hypothetical protein
MRHAWDHRSLSEALVKRTSRFVHFIATPSPVLFGVRARQNLSQNPIVRWMYSTYSYKAGHSAFRRARPKHQKSTESPANIGASKRALKTTTSNDFFNGMMSLWFASQRAGNGPAQIDRTSLMSKKAAITEIVKMRDQLVIMRERLFQLSAATAARTKESRNPREANETPT